MAGEINAVPTTRRHRSRRLLAGAVLLTAIAVPAGASTLGASGSASPFDGLTTPDGLSVADRVAPPAPEVPAARQVDEASLPDLANEVVQLTNAERAKAGLAPLTVHPLLVQAADAHAQDQRNVPCEVGFFSHTGTDGSRPLDRIQRTGIDISRWAENIACAYRSPSAVVRGWMNSPGHRANMLDPFLTHIGVAVAESSTGQRVWVQDFGTPR